MYQPEAISFDIVDEIAATYVPVNELFDARLILNSYQSFLRC